MNNMKSILWGVVLVLLGVLVGTNSLGITNIDIFFDGWWSLFIIIPCFIGLFSNEDKTGNIIGLLVGVILLLGMNNILDLDKIWKLIVPSIIVIIGLSLIFKNSFNSKVNDKINKLKYISLGDVFVLPVGYAVERTTQYETSLLPIDEDKAVGRMKETLKNELQRRIGDGQIVSAEYSVSKTDNVMTVTLRAQCTENIAKEADYD